VLHAYQLPPGTNLLLAGFALGKPESLLRCA
jgi:hypothetical protein